MQPARRMEDISPFHVMELMAKARALEAQGRDIVHMEVGEPDFPTAPPIIAAAQQAIAAGNIFYSNPLGLLSLRQAVAAYYQRQQGLHIDPARIVITAGASAALLLALGALISPGDEWLLSDPGYPCNRNFIRFCEGIPMAVAVGAETNFQPTAPLLASRWQANTRGVLISSPANPTGTLIEHEELRNIHAVVSHHRGQLIVDEIYHGLTYGCPARSALHIADDIIVVNSFSKYFGMTGWRLGWLVVPPSMLRDIEKLAQNLYIAPSTPAQHAAPAAFADDSLAIMETRRQEFSRRRDLLLAGLAQIEGFRIAAEPQGAFYIYADISSLANDSYALAEQLLAQAGVALTPGLDFGENAAEKHLRLAYTTANERLTEGIARLQHFFNTT